jgi:hypothetical protein
MKRNKNLKPLNGNNKMNKLKNIIVLIMLTGSAACSSIPHTRVEYINGNKTVLAKLARDWGTECVPFDGKKDYYCLNKTENYYKNRLFETKSRESILFFLAENGSKCVAKNKKYTCKYDTTFLLKPYANGVLINKPTKHFVETTIEFYQKEEHLPSDVDVKFTHRVEI